MTAGSFFDEAAAPQRIVSSRFLNLCAFPTIQTSFMLFCHFWDGMWTVSIPEFTFYTFKECVGRHDDYFLPRSDFLSDCTRPLTFRCKWLCSLTWNKCEAHFARVVPVRSGIPSVTVATRHFPRTAYLAVHPASGATEVSEWIRWSSAEVLALWHCLVFVVIFSHTSLNSVPFANFVKYIHLESLLH